MSGFQQRFASREDVAATHYEDDGRVVFVADFGPTSDGTVDVVDGTAIVVLGDDQHEFDVPAGESTAQFRNGIITVAVSDE